jgi:cell division protein FtsW (lipid II flippase)
MAITRISTIDRARLRNRYRLSVGPGNRSLESYLLVAASAVIAAGLFLAFQARALQLSEELKSASLGQPLDLNQVKSANELLPFLGILPVPGDRAFAAQRIYEYLKTGRIQSIGELRLIRATSEQIERGQGLSRYASALQEARGQATSRTMVSIPLFTPAEVHQMRVSFAVRTYHEFRRSLLLSILAFFAPFYAVHLIWWRLDFGGHRILLPLVHLLSGIGFIFMVRLRDPLREVLLYPDFAAGVAIGCGLLLICSLLDYERSLLRHMAYIPLLGSFLLSLVLLVFGSGPGVSDAKVNLSIGPFSMQPVEIIKALLILFLAGYFASRWELFRELKEPSQTLPRLIRRWNLPRLQYATPVLLAVVLAIVFFFLQKDLGPALVLASLFLALYAVARARAVAVLIAFGVLIASFWAGYQWNFPRTVSARVGIWLSPWDNYIRPGGDHLAQSLWTFASGGLFGTGLGLGKPETLPAVHTDLILAAVGEELGFIGLIGVLLLYALLLHGTLKISLAAPGHYTFFLCLGFGLLLGFQLALISGGVLGLVPLSGVVTPFLNYGKSSTLINFAVIGMLLSVSAHSTSTERNDPFRRPLAWIIGLFGIIAAAILIQATRVQVIRPNETMAISALVVQGDGHRRYVHNPRLLAAGESIQRGSIFDRNGIPLAASLWAPLEAHRADYQRLGFALDQVNTSGDLRQYPFGSLTYHLLGNLRTRTNWGAPNTSFIERDLNTRLQGYEDHAVVVKVKDQPEGPAHSVLHRDLRELIPIVRYRYKPGDGQVQNILRRDRDVHTTIDIRLQKAAAELIEQHIRAAKRTRGAAIVIDPATGNLLASVTYPWVGAGEAANAPVSGAEAFDLSGSQESLLDRPRYGLYPPGSSFKLVTATAALQTQDNAENLTYECKRLPDGRIGNFVRGWGHPVRDDILDKVPHGTVNLSRGVVLSCNAFFAQLGTYVVGAERLQRIADLFGIRVASPNTSTQLRDALPQASYGQGQVVVTPLQMARVAAAICNDGMSYPARWVLTEDSQAGKQIMPPKHARLLADYMRRVVTEGTGRGAATPAVPVAGKTGTAELRDKPSHAWFVGFAPYSRSATKKIAFAVIIENGQYGGRVAAPLAGDLAAAAARLGLIDRE